MAKKEQNRNFGRLKTDLFEKATSMWSSWHGGGGGGGGSLTHKNSMKRFTRIHPLHVELKFSTWNICHAMCYETNLDALFDEGGFPFHFISLPYLTLPFNWVMESSSKFGHLPGPLGWRDEIISIVQILLLLLLHGSKLEWKMSALKWSYHEITSFLSGSLKFC